MVVAGGGGGGGGVGGGGDCGCGGDVPWVHYTESYGVLSKISQEIL